MLLPEPVFVMLSTGVTWNLQTPMIVALTVTEVLSAWAEPAANVDATAALSSRRFRVRVLIIAPLVLKVGADRRGFLFEPDQRQRPQGSQQLLCHWPKGRAGTCYDREVWSVRRRMIGLANQGDVAVDPIVG